MRFSNRRLPLLCAAPLAMVSAILAALAPQPSDSDRPDRKTVGKPIEWRDSEAIGLPEEGSLERGIRLPATGRGFFTWDPVQRERPNRGWRRWGTDELVRTTLDVVRGFHRDHPNVRVGIGDLSRPRGGDFGPRYGYIGHATHQNGLDVDVYYPRLDRRERPPERVDQVDLELSQELVDRFLAAGPEVIYVGPSTPLTGPPGIVRPVVNHDNHLHVRIPDPDGS
jgi:murein endopeptidase